MISTAGHIFLSFTLVLAFLQGLFPFFTRRREYSKATPLLETLSLLQTFFIMLAFFTLMWAYVTSDFSVSNVAFNSHQNKPLFYKISGVWGNHEGSLLLWVMVLTLMTTVFIFKRPTPFNSIFYQRVLVLQGRLTFGFTAFLILTSNPFWALDPIPLAGLGLNPMLQDPALAIHPPVLYAGYVGYALPFSLAVATLSTSGKTDFSAQAWAGWIRPWSLIAWMFLTAGIALGAFWAYYELGWGGWWFWDPVENAALMPWLLGTALLHALRVCQIRKQLFLTSILLALGTFSFSVIGTFLVRSGLLTSIHSFAVDPSRGVFILGLIATILGSSLTLFALKASSFKNTSSPSSLGTREWLIGLNVLLLVVLTSAVLWGTLYPLLHELLTGEHLSVGPPYFHKTIIPLALPLLVLTGVGPFLKWGKKEPFSLIRPSLITGALTAFILFLGYFFLKDILSFETLFSAVCVALGGWIISLSLAIPHEKKPSSSSGFLSRFHGLNGMKIAHFGLGIMIIGMALDLGGRFQISLPLQQGETADLGGFKVHFQNIKNAKGANYHAERASIHVRSPSIDYGVLHPEKRFYDVQKIISSKTALKGLWLSDVHLILGRYLGENRWMIKFQFHPFIHFIWLGVGLICFGAGLSAFRAFKR